VFAELKDLVRDKIERYGLTRTINPRHFFPTIEAAVAAFQQQTGAEWVADTTPPPAATPPAATPPAATPPAATPPAATPQGSGPESGQDSEGTIRFG
jgi:hypothetical protein